MANVDENDENAPLVLIDAIVAKENCVVWAWLCEFVKLRLPPFLVSLDGGLCGELVFIWPTRLSRLM